MLGDTITQPPCTKELIRMYSKYKHPVIAVEKVPPVMIPNYGIISTKDNIQKEVFVIDTLIEKPSLETAPSDLAILGSYVLTPSIFEHIAKIKPDRKDELQLTDALRSLAEKEPILGHIYSGKRYDIGNKLDWLKSNIELSMNDPEFGKEISEFVRGL
jgi:UTP--glucose-1-phosphate uridylyltransferase